MKKILNLPLLLIMLLVSFTFIGCSDDEGEITTNNIVGTWKWINWFSDEDANDESLFESVEQYIQFKADGSYIGVDIAGDYIINGEVVEEGSIEVRKGTWVMSEDKLIIDDSTFNIDKLTDDELTISYMGIAASYSRVSDSEINQYLNE